MTDNEITMTSAEFKPPKKRKAIYPHITVGGKVDNPCYSIHWYDVEEGRMIEGYSSFSLKYVREWLEEYFEVVEDDIEPLINRQKAEIERLKQIVGFTPARGSRKSPLLNAVLDNVRAEAYRECIEKINKNLNSRASFGSMDESVICESIILENDDLLKELVGEDDG